MYVAVIELYVAAASDVAHKVLHIPVVAFAEGDPFPSQVLTCPLQPHAWCLHNGEPIIITHA